MFGLFKRKKREDEWQKILEEEEKRFHADILPIFQAVSEKLPSKYGHLKERFIPALLRGCKPNAIKGSGNLYVFQIDQFSHKKYETEKNNYLIQNIKIYSNTLQRFETLKLHINNNIPTAFEFSISDWNFDLSKIDATQTKEFHWDNSEYQNWMRVIGKVPLEHSKRIDLQNGFEVELDGSKYFTIKDFGNGDYIAIKDTREIYGLIHGKNLIEKLFNSPEEFYAALEKKTFDFDQYHLLKA
jgi:hypothetical protein